MLEFHSLRKKDGKLKKSGAKTANASCASGS